MRRRLLQGGRRLDQSNRRRKQGLQTRIDELEALLDQRYTPPAPRASGKTVNADVLAAEARGQGSTPGAAAPRALPPAAPAPARARHHLRSAPPARAEPAQAAPR